MSDINLENMLIFESSLIKTEVTAVKVLPNVFLAGVGGYLNIFGKNYKYLRKISVFDGQKIYSILPAKYYNKVLLHGANKMKVFACNENFSVCDEVSSKNADDWILSAKWIENESKVVTVFMHNKIAIWNEKLEKEYEISCEEKCILYSAFICYDTVDKMVVLSGTVFSEVLIWKPVTENTLKASSVLKRLKEHKGVIFSVDYNEKPNMICSTSDDRSAILWKINGQSLADELKKENVDITIHIQVLGHTARIFRCFVSSTFFITGGEDSLLNIWNFNGSLLRKIETHQGDSVWAIDCDESNEIIITGGGDGGVTVFPIATSVVNHSVMIPDGHVPKTVGILKSNNLLVMSEKGILFYYIKRENLWKKIKEHEDLMRYSLLEISKCRNFIALAGMKGQIYIYKEELNNLRYISSFETIGKSRIYSLHWLTCKTFLICENEGILSLLYLKNEVIRLVTNFILPISKERWTTAACLAENGCVIMGDRKGNIYLFHLEKQEVVQTIKNAHNYLGVTHLQIEKSNLISLGRNGYIIRYLLNNRTLHMVSSDKVPFSWLHSIVGDLLLAFFGDNFIIWNYKTRRALFEKSCGGGHRSLDFKKDDINCYLIYIKDKILYSVECDLSNISPTDLIEGYHAREINALKVIQDHDDTLFISGGEDTTLRISILCGESLKTVFSLKSHLSSIRTITAHKLKPSDYLIFSAGGRAQIVCWKLNITHENNLIRDVSCSEEHSFYEPLQTNESEMRIMDLEIVQDIRLLLFAACSDGNIKVFEIVNDVTNHYNIKFLNDFFYKRKCIMKLCFLKTDNFIVLCSMATDGCLVFWDLKNMLTEPKSICSFETHQSGINSYSFKLIGDDKCVFLTGGDDSAVILTLLQFSLDNGVSKIERLYKFKDDLVHCAQVTGALIYDQYFVTSSVDQRLVIFKWNVFGDKVDCKPVYKYNSCVSDIQGIACFRNNSKFLATVFGKGVEIVNFKCNL